MLHASLLARPTALMGCPKLAIQRENEVRVMAEPAYRNGLDFEKHFFRAAQEKLIAEAESRLRSEQKDAEQRHNAALVRIENKLDNFIVEANGKFDRIEDKFKQIDDRFNRLEGTLDDFKKETKGNFDRLEDKLDSFKRWAMGILITMLVSFIAMLAAIFTQQVF